MAIYRELDDRWRIAGLLRGLGSSAIDRGELDDAVALLEESLALAREIGNTWEAAAAANLLGTIAAIRGDFSKALVLHEEAAAGWRHLEDLGHVVTALTSGAWAALLGRELDRAAVAYQEALRMAAAGEDDWFVAWCVVGAGGLAAARGDARAAAELLAVGARERKRLGVPLRPPTEAALEALIAGVRARLGEAEYLVSWKVGRAMPITEATARAFEIFATVIARAPSPHGLTRREHDVLRLLADGQSDKEIAQTLFIRLGAESRTAAAKIAMRHGLV
jgi:ATP/maltotriose-dependent transcriptional regulator MalT